MAVVQGLAQCQLHLHQHQYSSGKRLVVAANVNERNLELVVLVQLLADQHQRHLTLDGRCLGKAVVERGRASSPPRTKVDGHHPSRGQRIEGLHRNDAEQSSSFVTMSALKADLLVRPAGTRVQLRGSLVVLLHHLLLIGEHVMACLLLAGRGLEPDLRLGLDRQCQRSRGRRLVVEMKVSSRSRN